MSLPHVRALLLGSTAFGVEAFRLARRQKQEKTQSGELSDCYSKYDGRPLLELEACSTQVAASLAASARAAGCYMLEAEELTPAADGGCGSTLAICDVARLSQLKREHTEAVRTITADSGAYYRELSGVPQGFVEALAGSLLQTQGRSSSFFSKWRNMEAKQARIDAAVNSSGGAAQIEVFGKSVQGRPLKLVRFTGNGYKPGMPKVVLTYQVHAREWIAGMAGVHHVENLVEKAKAEPKWLDGVELVLVPLSNPDGYVFSMTKDRFHRKNMRVTKAMEMQMAMASANLDEEEGNVGDAAVWETRAKDSVDSNSCSVGVDINRNAPTGWASTEARAGSAVEKKQYEGMQQCGEVFGGVKAMSEPETQAIVKLFKEAPMSVYVDVHAYSQFILTSWSYTKDVNPRKAEFDVLGKSVQQAMKKKHGKTYKVGTTPDLLYVASGTLPDHATSLGALGMTIELRPDHGGGRGTAGFAPPPSQILPAAEESYEGVLAAIAHAKTIPKKA